MPPRPSSIPHLARAILEKRASSLSKPILTRPASQHAAPRIATRPAAASTPNKKKKNPFKSTPPPPPGSPPERPVAVNARTYRVMLIATTAFAAVLGLYTMTVYTRWSNSLKKHAVSGRALPQDADVTDRWRQLGRDYDAEVEFSEGCFVTKMTRKRRRMAARAYGKVLEVSAGTGRNLEYYNLSFDPTAGGGGKGGQNVVASLTVNDQSAVMMAAAERKYEALRRRGRRAVRGEARFVVGDAGVAGVIERPVGGYDTIVQTMGLCSMVDPVGSLRVMGRLCRQPGEASDTKDLQSGSDDGKGGRILLLEHGRSRFDVVNRILDSGASMHADHYGCWWNKDIGDIVEQSGLEIEKITRYHLGTTWEIHLRPKQSESTGLTK